MGWSVPYRTGDPACAGRGELSSINLPPERRPPSICTIDLSSRLDRTVQARAGDLQRAANLGYRVPLIVVERLSARHLLRVQHLRPAVAATACPSGDESCLGGSR